MQNKYDKLFFEAVAEGDIERVKKFLAPTGMIGKFVKLLFGPNINAQNIRSGDTPLHAAVISGKLEIARLLLAQTNIKIKRKNKSGKTPLYVSLELGVIIATQLLLNHGEELDEEAQQSIFESCIRNQDKSLFIQALIAGLNITNCNLPKDWTVISDTLQSAIEEKLSLATHNNLVSSILRAGTYALKQIGQQSPELRRHILEYRQYIRENIIVMKNIFFILQTKNKYSTNIMLLVLEHIENRPFLERELVERYGISFKIARRLCYRLFDPNSHLSHFFREGRFSEEFFCFLQQNNATIEPSHSLRA